MKQLEQATAADGDEHRVRRPRRHVHARADGPRRHPRAVPAFPDALGADRGRHGLKLRTPWGRLSFLTTLTVFGAPYDVTLSELALETFFPADEATAATLRALAPA